ncbi:MAG: DNA-3-methyladenine glycosylase family protein [Bacteroidales bacterium]
MPQSDIDYARAIRHLTRRDPILAAIIKRHGHCGLADAQREDPFRAIVEAIVWQQLSGKAAATIFGRFLGLFPNREFPTPEQLTAKTDEELRAVGFSRQKIGYLRDLCEKMRTGELHLDRLEPMTDDEVIEHLTHVKGIGRWTAEMVLMFRLHRPDVLPVDDLGIVKAVRKAYRLRKDPDADRLRQIGEKWRPYRSVASWYLWASLENTPLDE